MGNAQDKRGSGKGMEHGDRERLIFHIDVNSAFLSWECVYRLSHDPDALDLRTIPSAVGGDASMRHGIVLAKSPLARKYGVTTGEPLAQARRKCPNLTVVPSRFDFYIKCSRRMMELLEEYTPDHEKFSIDEIFLDMTETIHLFGDPLATASQIRSPMRFPGKCGRCPYASFSSWAALPRKRWRPLAFIPSDSWLPATWNC